MFLTAFGLHNPFAGLRLQAHGPIPIAAEARGGLDLDYSALLIAGSFIIDRTAYEYVKDRRRMFLGPMFHSLEVLENEGFLEIADYSETILKHRAEIVAKTAQALESIDVWLAIARNQWMKIKPEFDEFARLHSLPDQGDYDKAHYGIVSYLERRDGRVNPTEGIRLHRLFESNKRRLSISEKDEMKRVLEPLVAQVLMNDLLRHSLQAPFLDWDDAQGFHDQLHLGQWSGFQNPDSTSTRMANQARCLFQIVLPELLPERIEDLVKFLKNRKAVHSLREELWRSLQEGRGVSDDWMLQLQREATSAQLQAEKRNRLIKWAGRAVNLFLPFGGPAVELIGEVAVNAAEDGAEKLSGNLSLSRFEWYYVLQRMKMT